MRIDHGLMLAKLPTELHDEVQNLANEQGIFAVVSQIIWTALMSMKIVTGWSLLI